MQRSFSVLLPVKNAQATLNTSVHEILEMAADSGDRFELLIIDDGSTDATSEIAHELTHHYPQVRMVCHGKPMGREAAIRTGLQRSRGDMVMLRDDENGFRLLEHPPEQRSQVSSHPTRPNYLRRLKNFALGE